jgi:hypothetical protein
MRFSSSWAWALSALIDFELDPGYLFLRIPGR